MILLLALVASLQDNAVDRYIQQLQSDKPELREVAATQLRKLGAEAQPALETAAKAPDPEIAQRAQEILRQLNSDLAQAEFTKLRDRIDKAKTIQIRFEGLMDDAEGRESLRKGFRGYWVIGNGGKALGVCSIKTSIDESHHGYLLCQSDGTKAVGGCPSNPDKPVATPKNFRSDLLLGLSNLGTIRSTLIFLREPIDFKQPHLPCAPPVLTSGFQILEHKETKTKELVYTIHDGMDGGTVGPPTLKCQLWYDSASGVPRKRTVILFDNRTGAPESIISEAYTEFSFDEEIPEERFKF